MKRLVKILFLVTSREGRKEGGRGEEGGREEGGRKDMGSRRCLLGTGGKYLLGGIAIDLLSSNGIFFLLCSPPKKKLRGFEHTFDSLTSAASERVDHGRCIALLE